MRALTLPGQFGLDDEIEMGEVDEPLPAEGDEPFLAQGDEMIDTGDPTQVMQDFQDRLFDLVPIPSMLLTYNITDTILMKTSTLRIERWRREFSGTDEEGDVSMEDVVIGEGSSAAVNRFAPFASELDWRVACWAIQDGIGHKSFDRLMAIPGVAEKLGLSYQNIRGLHKIVDAVPPRATWKKRELWFKNDPEDKHIVHHRDPLEAIKTLLGNPAHAEHVVYRPKKIFSDASKSKRIYNEMWTGDWWNTVQDRLPSGACVAPVIIATDKTQLTQFTGGKTAYPVYLTLGNLPRAICRKPSQQACILIAYLSVSKMVGKQLTKKQKSTRIQQLFHDSMRIVLEPLIEAGKKGMEVTGGDGKVRILYPILACYVADYPEQCLVTCAKYGTCPKCQLIRIAREKATSISNFQELCKVDNISGGVRHPFWEDFPHCDIHMGITSDVLHQLYQGVVKHLEHWCTSLMTTAELDHRIRSLPPCFGVRHFKNGWSQLSQVSGKERKDMARILLGCIMGKAPSQVIVCYRALLDFIYVAQYPTHDDSTLQYLTNALDEFHANKDILVDLGIRNHFNIPKFHSMLHYEECIHYAKEAWRASNFRNELPQMTQWLSRQEKIVMFQSYISHYQSEEEREEEVQEAVDGRNQDVGVVTAKRPAAPSQTLSNIQTKHGCPSFSYHLRIFLNKFLTRGDSIPRTQVGNAFLPFDKLDVWHSFKFSLDTLGNDVDGQKGIDLVRAQPGRGKSPGRFDVVVVTHNDGAESTGLHGAPPYVSNT
ncbi:hypothetical protein F4604DRAFT_1944865 [Suillus subluteus]|nr:hypothetical protein F4604DRAFT_1944865 [Suillus subluteus]